MSSYCQSAPGHEIHGPYHDHEYGFPTSDETVLFERLALEIMQAGLSWLTVLKKRNGLNSAFDNFSVDAVAAYAELETERLLADANIIRNRLKIAAIIDNAKTIKAMRHSHGGFSNWLDKHHPLNKEDWVKLFKKTFKFTGGEITGEFLMSTGYLSGTHDMNCPVYEVLARLNPPWMDAQAK